MAIATTTRTSTGASPLASTLVVTRRSLVRFLRTPQLIVLGTIQGALFLLIYRYVFGGAMNTGGGVPYVDYLVPGFLCTLVLYTGMGAAAGLAEDLAQGFVDRLRSLPIPRASVLAGRALADMVMMLWSLVVTTAVGFAFGFRFHGSAAEALAAFGLCVVFGFAFEWLFIAAGTVAGNAQAAQGIGFLVFPLTFVSSAYVPVASMPVWLRVIADHQPITMMVDAVRSLALGPQAHALLQHSTGWYVVGSLLWAAGIVAVFAPLAAWRFGRS